MDMNQKALKSYYENEKETFLECTKQDVIENFWYCLGLLDALLSVRAINVDEYIKERATLEKAYEENKPKGEE